MGCLFKILYVLYKKKKTEIGKYKLMHTNDHSKLKLPSEKSE